MKNKPTVLAVMPTHSQSVDMKCFSALRNPTQRGDFVVTSRIKARSLLAACFNEFWCMALNERFDYFAMLHADVSPQPGWLDILMDEMKRTGADVVSVVIPIKEPEMGLTSTAIGDPSTNWRPRRRLTMHEVYELPETFDAADAGYPGDALLVNTGCFLVDLSKPWCRATKPDGTAEFHFTINDKIQERAGQFEHEVEPEDWYASRQWARLDAKVVATRKVALNHRGVADFPNTSPWGDLKEDFTVTDEEQMVNRDAPYKTKDGREVIHVHIPKNGGTSIWQILGKPPEIEPRTTHLAVKEWRNLLGDERYEKAVSFAVCRNPYDRLYSAWAYFTGPHPTPKSWPGIQQSAAWVQHNSGRNCTFEHFLLNAPSIEHQTHFIPQWRWMAGDGDDAPDLDTLLPFENLAAEWVEFCDERNLHLDPLPHHNASVRGPWREAYTVEMIERANEIYAKDFEILPYDMVTFAGDTAQLAGTPA